MFDCIVIGGGIIGANILHQLAARVPEWKIALIEQALVGSGASFYSAGLSLPYGRSAFTRKLAHRSEKLYAELTKQFYLPINQLPFIGIVSENNLTKEYSYFIHSPINNFNNSLQLSAGKILIEKNESLLQIRNCHYSNVHTITTLLINHARQHSSIEIWEGSKVQNIFSKSGGIQLKLQNNVTLKTRNVILAPGPWINCDPYQSYSETMGIRTKKVVAFHINKIPQQHDSIVFFLDHDAFLLPLITRGHWLFSYTCQEWDVKPYHPSLLITAKDRQDAITILKQYCPELANHCHSGRVFCDAYAPDRTPIIAPLPSMNKVIFAGAANGSGYRLAPAIAEKAVQLMLEADQ